MAKHNKRDRDEPRISPRRRSRTEVITTAATQDVSDLGTSDILRRRSVLQCEIDATEGEIAELTSRVAAGRAKRERLFAVMVGLNLAISRRQICD